MRIDFSILNASGVVVRSGTCLRAELAQQRQPGETLVAGRRLQKGHQLRRSQPSLAQRLEALEKRLAALERKAARS